MTLDGRLFDYRWSSYPFYVRAAGWPAWFEPRAVPGELGLADTPEDRRRYAERRRARAVTALTGEETATLADLRRGWRLDGAGFRERMLRLLDGTAEKLGLRREVDAPVRPEHGEDEARRILDQGMRRLGLTVAELATLKKCDARKLALATVIRQRTTVPNAWLARELHLGHVSRVSRCWQTTPEADSLIRQILSTFDV